MFQYQAILGIEFERSRDPTRARQLSAQLQSFDAWVAANAARIPISSRRPPRSRLSDTPGWHWGVARRSR
jgi:hypothetical protein